MCCDHILGAIELKLGIRIPFGCEFNFLKLNPPSLHPSGEGSSGGGVLWGMGPYVLGVRELCHIFKAIKLKLDV